MCRTASATGSAPALPLPLAASGMTAETRFDEAQQTAFAAGGVGDLRVRSLPALPIQLPQPSFEELGSVDTPVGTVDLRPALQALVPARQLPDMDLVRAQGVRAEASGRCVDGAPALTGAAAVSQLTINGADVGAGQAHDRSVTLIDSQGIDPSDVDVTQIVRPPGVPLAALQAVIQPVLDALPDVAIPATVAQVRVTPGQRAETAGRLTQTGPRVSVTIAGQNVADLTLGEATVGASQVGCASGSAAVADLALACTTRRLVLIDVLRRGNRVRLLGAAARVLAGRRVAIRFTATGRTVARPRIGADGLFRASAPLPRAALRRTNRARYEAVLGAERSLRLKLSRRMVVTGTSASGGRVTIAGRVLGPLGRPARAVVVERRLSCGGFEVVRRFRPGRGGRFRITVRGPEGTQAAVFRLRTQVRRNTRSRSLFPTFTLPRFVDLS